MRNLLEVCCGERKSVTHDTLIYKSYTNLFSMLYAWKEQYQMQKSGEISKGAYDE